ncbi:glutathione transferase GstA [Peredibacter sp. HCB2-198]|uniref:glutathione transferase GstA n=1 Tax=Peredibacter sp. HCB2-198 TaxID=3383025 RepID=UPI0038B56E31
MRLYYKAGACSLAPHIVMAELNMVYEIEAVDLANKTCASGDYKMINPKGSVPALRMENGEVLTEGAVIMQYLADQNPEAGLMPKLGTTDRYRCMEWLNFIASEVHKNFTPLFRTSVKNAEGLKELKDGQIETLKNKIGFISEKLGSNDFLMGKTFTVADAYLFTCLGWGKFVGLDVTQWSNIANYMARIAERPTVMRAMKEEGLLK